jgi:hypothetical protein
VDWNAVGKRKRVGGRGERGRFEGAMQCREGHIRRVKDMVDLCYDFHLLHSSD